MTPSQIDAISATSAQNRSAQNSDYVDLADQPLFHKTDATFDRFVAISHFGTQGQACAAPIRIQSSPNPIVDSGIEAGTGSKSQPG